MKGLLLKDWYAIKSYCLYTLFIVLVFAILGGAMQGNFFFTFYPLIFISVIAMNLIAYEEKEKWDQYAATLPYTKAQIVSSKYIVSLCLGLGTVVLSGISQYVGMIVANTYNTEKLLSYLMIFVSLALLPAAFLLPFIYKFGVNKGRIAYYVVIIVSCGVIGGIASVDSIGSASAVSASQISIFVIVAVASAVIYALSWMLSIRFYQNREI
ncbi:MAG: ABC-2 transporter permease [Oscillospiraceae bacterium]|nr:ABC-2 transporter permease [Oscillospiraceae bacterium]